MEGGVHLLAELQAEFGTYPRPPPILSPFIAHLEELLECVIGEDHAPVTGVKQVVLLGVQGGGGGLELSREQTSWVPAEVLLLMHRQWRGRPRARERGRVCNTFCVQSKRQSKHLGRTLK